MKTHEEKSNSKLIQSEKGFLYLSQKPALIDSELTGAVESDELDEKKSVSVVLNYGTHTPNGFPFDPYEAYKIRLVSFANGAIYAIKNGEQRDKLNKIIEIKKILEKKINELEDFKNQMAGDNNVSFGSELYQFYKKDLPKISGLKPKEIALGEAMYVWQEVPRPTRKTSYLRTLNGDNAGYLRVEQYDEPRISELTSGQQAELKRIFDAEINHPDWFKALAPFAQNALKKLLKPDGKSWNWKNFEKCHPTILRHILGEANATTHRFKITHVKKNGVEILLSDTVSIRQGAPTSFNMENKNERVVSAKENLNQMLSNTAKQSARDSFKEAWGISDEKDNTKFPLPVVLVGLLTPANQAGYFSALLDRARLTGGESNTLLTNEKNTAFSAWHDPNDKTIQAFNLNVGVNWQRDGVIEPDKKFIFFVNKFHSDMFTHLQLNLNQFSPEKWSELKRKLEQLVYVKSALNALDGKPSSEEGRNENLYTAALYDVAARLMYGLDTGNCKSSKDRKGVEFIMADAMLAYLAEKEALGETPRLPGINDKNPERARFVEIFCELYASGHQLLLAHDNSPGCPGIKDEGILDEDIKAKLNEMRMTYAQSKKIAHLNKPGTFWKTHGSKIIKGTMIGGAAILGVAAIVCTATGILSPLGIISGAAATQLGAAALSVGWAVNIAIPMATGAGIARLCCGVADMQDKNQHTKGLFKEQIKRAKAKNASNKGKKSTKATPLSVTSTAQTNPLTPPTNRTQPAITSQASLSPPLEKRERVGLPASPSITTQQPNVAPKENKYELLKQLIIKQIKTACEELLDNEENAGSITAQSFTNHTQLFPVDTTRHEPENVRILLIASINDQVSKTRSSHSSEAKSTDITFFNGPLNSEAMAHIKQQLPTWVNDVLIEKYQSKTDKFTPITLSRK